MHRATNDTNGTATVTAKSSLNNSLSTFNPPGQSLQTKTASTRADILGHISIYQVHIPYHRTNTLDNKTMVKHVNKRTGQSFATTNKPLFSQAEKVSLTNGRSNNQI
jgi:hypothetical protein